jgi:tetratricopeptide (TPR) repeat protein
MNPGFFNNHPLPRIISRAVDFLCRRRGLHAVASVLLAIAANGVRAQGVPSAGEVAERYRQEGLSQATSGHIDQALEAFKKGLEISPHDARLLDATGAAYSLKGDLKTARQYFEESLKINPTSLSTRQNLGITLFGLGDDKEAATQFSSIQEIDGKPRAVANLFLGLIAQRQADCKDALPLMEASGSLLYQYPDALLSYAECTNQIGDRKRTEESLAAFEKLPGSTAAQRKQAADLYSQQGLNAKAHGARANETTESAAADPDLKQAILLEKSQRLDEAQRLLENATSSQPTFDSLFELATVAKERGDFATAMKSLKRAAQIDPKREDSYLEFSTICADHGNDQLALDSAEIGLEHVPGSYRLTVQKGAVQEKLGHLNDAEETLKKAIGMQNDNSVAQISLAVVQAHGGKTDEAERTLSNAIRQFPDNYYMFYFQGKLLKQVGADKPDARDTRDSARRSFQESIRLNPNYADSYYQLSDLYLGDSPKLAEQALDKCLKLDPNHIPAQYSLARLYVRTGRKEEGQVLLERMKTQQRSEELQQQKQVRIEVAQN